MVYCKYNVMLPIGFLVIAYAHDMAQGRLYGPWPCRWHKNQQMINKQYDQHLHVRSELQAPRITSCKSDWMIWAPNPCF